MAYVDLNTIDNPTTGQPIPAAWGDQVRDNLEFLIDPPFCSVFNSAPQSVSTGGSGAVMTADSENFDNDSMHSTSVETGRITIQTAGRYVVFCTMLFAANATGTRSINFLLDDTTSTIVNLIPTAGASLSTVISGQKAYDLDAGQWIEATGFQNSGGNLNITLQEFGAYFLTR